MFDRSEFSTFLTETGISQNKAAEGIGYSAAVVSQIMAGTYSGNTEAVEDAITAWMARERSRRAARVIPYVETDISRRIMNAIEIVHEERDIGVIAGPAGVGKTTTLLKYRDLHPTSCVYVEIDASMNKTALMHAIATGLGVEANGEFTGLVRRVIAALSGHDYVVMIDQADYLSDGSLELLRQVVNDKGKSGLLLIGLERIEFRLKNVKNDHQQLLSRIGVMLRLESAKPADAERILASVWPGLDKETKDAFVKTADKSLRRLSKLIDRCHRTMITNKRDKPDPDVVAVAGSLILKA